MESFRPKNQDSESVHLLVDVLARFHYKYSWYLHQ
jgi:hypothetical protein